MASSARGRPARRRVPNERQPGLDEAQVEWHACAMPRFAAVVFDMDGLLLDSERPLLDAWVTAARELGHPFEPALLARVLGRPGKDGVAMFRDSLGASYPYERVRERAKVLLEAERAEGPRVKAGARALLECLRTRGVPCAVASSSKRAQVDSQLRQVGLLSFFSALVGGDEVAQGKPAPEIFLRAASLLEIQPSRCLVFEDSEHGARGAVAAEMSVVIVPDVNPPSDEARAFCFRVLDSLADAEAHADEWFV